MSQHASQSNGHNKLTLKQELFIEAYLGKAKGNATEAARIAGYSGNDNTLSQTGLKLVRNGKVAKLIEKRVDKAVMTADEVLKELATLAKMKWNTKGFRASDKIKALELVGKYHALFTDRHSLSGRIETELIKPTTSTIVIQGVKGDTEPRDAELKD